MATAIEIRIDKEFAALCPPLTPEERNLLEASLDANGCMDPLVIWRGLLVDGHNRFEYCTSAGIDYLTHELKADSREDVIEWIIRNQLGRRNLSEEQKSYLRGKRYVNEKKSQGGDRKSKRHSDALNNTAEKVATDCGVSDRTIERDAKFATAVDALAKNVGPEIKSEILSGESPLSKKQIVAIAELPPKQQAKAVAEQAKPTPKPKAFDYDAACIRVMDVGRKIMEGWPEEYRPQLSKWFLQLSKEALIIVKED